MYSCNVMLYKFVYDKILVLIIITYLYSAYISYHIALYFYVSCWILESIISYNTNKTLIK